MRRQNENPVRAAREAANLSQVQLAVRTKLSLNTVRNAEYGIATTRTLSAIAKVLGVDVDVLLGRKSPEFDRERD